MQISVKGVEGGLMYSSDTLYHARPSPNYDSILSVVSFYLSSLSVAHIRDALRRRLVNMGDGAKIQDETSENSAWLLLCLVTRHNSADSLPTSNLVYTKEVAIITTFSHTINDIAGIIWYTCGLIFDIERTRYKNALRKRF